MQTDKETILIELIENMRVGFFPSRMESFLAGKDGYRYVYFTKLGSGSWAVTNNAKELVKKGTLDECVDKVMQIYW